ncbi:MAG: OmpA family protein [Putridiphycobacter sp.]
MKNHLKKLFLVTTIVFCQANLAFAQNKFLLAKKAEKKIEQSNFNDGIKLFQQALLIDSSYYLANHGLAETYYFLEVYDSSKIYFERSIRHSPLDTNYFDFLYLGICLRHTNEPQKALQTFNYFEKKFNNLAENQELQSFLLVNKSYCLEQIENYSNINHKIIVNNLGKNINTTKREYASIFLNNDSTILYTGRYKDFNNEFQYIDDYYFENIYSFNYKDSSLAIFNKNNKQNTHYSFVGRVGLSDSLLVYYKNKLWIANINKTQDLTPLPAVFNDFYQITSGVFSKNQNSFFFTGKYEKNDDLDLFVSYKKNGVWTIPIVLKNLSSELDEDSPYLADHDSTLYFSSKGFDSSGDYDIFKSNFEKDNWTKPQNLGYPINSPSHDNYFIIMNNQGFLSSNRICGFGTMDLYSIQTPPPADFNCKQFENPELTVNFSISQSIDPNSVPLTYNWKFDDGDIFIGTDVKKTFLFPGKHYVNIDILDETSGFVEKNEIFKEILIDSVEFVGFSHPRYHAKDSVYILDGSISYLKEEEIMEYHWKVEDTIINFNGPKLEMKFNNRDSVAISLQINTIKKQSYHSYCYSAIIPPIKYTESDSSNNLPFVNQQDVVSDSNNQNNLIQNVDTTSIPNRNWTSIDTSFFKPIYFNFDKYFLTNKSKSQLDSVIDYLFSNPNTVIILQGHTDAMGTSAYNDKLSARRIQATYKYLISHGLSSNRIYKTIAYGEKRPAEPNQLPNGKDNPVGRALNRRVEIYTYIIYE